VILELVGAPHFPGNLEVLSTKGGRIVIVGVAAGHEIHLPLLRLMQKRATLRGTVLRARALEEKAFAVRAFEREVVPALENGTLRPIVDRIFPAADVAVAFDHLVAPGKVGKVLLQFE
jgi:NADPH:quinone reductase-like Zn-dependent oxidoreductase